MSNPKLFVSYSWTSPDHEEWVLQLATELLENGVDVILDKWHLREGHDANAFMEKMVTDPEIRKVILICDQAYAEKANTRSGGVGTEAQIISGKIYAAQDQEKFVAILKERDEEGRAYLPVYYQNRIFIDLSDPSTYAENFERLLRWVYDKPVYRKPEIGKMPAFLAEENTSAILATASRFKRAVDALKNGRPHATAAVAEYFDVFSGELENLRLDKDADPFDEAVIKSIENFIPYRNECIEIFQTLALYLDNDEIRSLLHRFFESLLPYLKRPQHITSYREWDFDNYRFIVHELFLYAITVFIKNERFQTADSLMRYEYFLPGASDYGQDVMVPFDSFRDHMKSLESRKARLKMNRSSLRADLLEQRCKGIGVEFRHLMQTDFILFLRDHLDRPDQMWHWYPETLLFVGLHSSPFEIFARSSSKKYFNRVNVLLGIERKEDLQPVLQKFDENPQMLPRWEFRSFSPRHLLNYDQVASKP